MQFSHSIIQTNITISTKLLRSLLLDGFFMMSTELSIGTGTWLVVRTILLWHMQNIIGSNRSAALWNSWQAFVLWVLIKLLSLSNIPLKMPPKLINRVLVILASQTTNTLLVWDFAMSFFEFVITNLSNVRYLSSCIATLGGESLRPTTWATAHAAPFQASRRLVYSHGLLRHQVHWNRLARIWN